jgi:hypothetical protein
MSTPAHVGVLHARTGCGRPTAEDRLLKDIAAAPYGLDIMISTGRPGEFFAQMADKDINDFEPGFLYPAVEVLEKHLLGYDRALLPGKQLKQVIFLARQVHRPSSTDTIQVSKFTTSLPVRIADLHFFWSVLYSTENSFIVVLPQFGGS